MNRAYLLLSVLTGLLAFVEFGYARSTSVAEDEIWRNAHVFWPFVLAALVYFSFVFAVPGFYRYKRLHLVLVLLLLASATFLTVKGLLSPPLAVDTGVHRYGWIMGTIRSADNMAPEKLFFWATWGAAYLGLISLLTQRELPYHYDKVKLPLLAGVLSFLYLLLSSFGHILSPHVEPHALPLGTIVVALLAFFCLVVRRYEKMALVPITVADSIVSAMYDTLLLVDTNLEIASFNSVAPHMLETEGKELLHTPVRNIFDKGVPLPAWLDENDDTVPSSEPFYLDSRLRTKAGRRLPVSILSSVLLNEKNHVVGYLLIARDIEEQNRREQELKVYKNQLERLVKKRTKELTQSLEELKWEIAERARAEKKRESLKKERASLEEQLYHAQKMESIGRLAGGVAHDFNNLLFVINTYTESFLKNMPPEHPLYDDFQEIYRAADRATSLTQQLLAFSRKQISAPQLVDPNRAITDISKMLSRIIGEAIQLRIEPSDDDGQIAIDPGQLDQILVNLAINARDAMPSGGTITIQNSRTLLTKAACADKENMIPGDYIVVEFADEGVGMDEETLSKIFDPFFTTKEPGSGTGLGLSTIYGIVRQNGGFLNVVSRINIGTTFSIYLPRQEPKPLDEEAAIDIIALRGEETILLVEDEPQVRHLAARLLEQLGYRVIVASGAGEAMLAIHEQKDSVDLLFTDIVMPGISGRQLSSMLHQAYPNLKVLFMSGYNDEISAIMDGEERDTPFLIKPFSFKELSSKVREVLDA